MNTFNISTQRQRQIDLHELQASLVDIASSRPARTILKLTNKQKTLKTFFSFIYILIIQLVLRHEFCR